MAFPKVFSVSPWLGDLIVFDKVILLPVYTHFPS